MREMSKTYLIGILSGLFLELFGVTEFRIMSIRSEASLIPHWLSVKKNFSLCREPLFSLETPLSDGDKTT